MSRSPLLRPTLLPGLARVWRTPHTLQLGLDPTRAVLLDLPDPRAAQLLGLLDGTRPERAVLLRAADLGVAPDEARSLLDSLHAAGLLLPAPSLLPPSLPEATRRRLTLEATALALGQAGPAKPPPQRGTDGSPPRRVQPERIAEPAPSPARTLHRRTKAKIVIVGRGRLAAPIAVALAEAGVGHVDPDLPGAVIEADLPGGPLHPADIGLPRRAAVAAAVQRAAPGTATKPVRRGTATMTIQLAYDQPVALLAAHHASRRQPHLAVAIREGAAVIGPLVPPSGGPCLNCLDMHRRDRDAGWPGLSAQLRPEAPEPCAVTTLLAAASYATAEALAFLDGVLPETLGASIEITAPGRFRRRSWPPHPACGCTTHQAPPDPHNPATQPSQDQSTRRQPNKPAPDSGASSGGVLWRTQHLHTS